MATESTSKIVGNVVTFVHVTKTVDGEATLTTSFDFTNVNRQDLMLNAARHLLITWRASVGIKEMPTHEAMAKLNGQVVDASKRVSKVESEETKALKDVLAGLQAKGKSLAEILETLKSIS